MLNKKHCRLTISRSSTYNKLFLDIMYTAITTGFSKQIVYDNLDSGINPLHDNIVLIIPEKYKKNKTG